MSTIEAARELLEDERAAECYECAEKLFHMGSQQGDSAMQADAMRLMILSRHFVAEENGEKPREADKMARDALANWENAEDERNVAVILLATAEINADKRGSKRREKALGQCQRALNCFRDLGDRQYELRALLALSKIYYKQLESEDTIRVSREALELSQELGDTYSEATCLHRIGLGIGLDATSCAEAVDYGNQAIKVFRRFGKEKRALEVLRSMTHWHLLADDPQKALSVSQEGLQKAKDTRQDPKHEARMVVAVVNSFIARDLPTQATYVAEEAIERFSMAGDVLAEIAAREALVSARIACEKYQDALDAADVALDKIREHGDKKLEIKMLVTVGETHSKMENYNDGLGPLCEARAQATDIGETKLEALAIRHLANTYLYLENYTDAVKLANEARATYRKCGDRQGEGEAMVVIFGAEAYQQHFEKAVDALSEAQELFQEAGNQRKAAAGWEAIAEMHSSRRNWGRALANTKLALDIWQELGDKKREAGAMHNMASILLSRQQPKAAQRVCEEMLLVCKAAKSNEYEVDRLILLTQVELSIAIEAAGDQVDKEPPSADDLKPAIQVANEAVSKAKLVMDEKYMAAALNVRAQVHMWMIDPDSGIADTDKAASIFKSRDCKGELSCVKALAAHLYLQGNDAAWAKEVAEEALAMAQEAGNNEGESLAQQALDRVAEGEKKAAPKVEVVAAPVAVEQPAFSSVVAVAKKPMLEPAMIRNKVMKVATDVMVEEEIELDTVLMETGLDSLSSLDFVSQISSSFKEFKLGLQPALMFDFPSVRAICDHIFEEASARMG